MNTKELLLETADQPRMAIECELRPLQGSRFQATGFPDLGPARYQRPDGTEMLLVESAQSMANRLEAQCWDEAADDVVPVLAGMPYVRVVDDGRVLTTSILEAHRVNSPYIIESEDTTFLDLLKNEAQRLEWGPVDRARLAAMVFRYDPNSIVHGAFLAKKDLAGGRLRLTRALTAFVEAEDVREAESGGVKNDHVDPSGNTTRDVARDGHVEVESGGVKNDHVDPSGNTAQGFGNVPFHRTEFTAGRIRAYFSLDLALLRGYRLPDPACEFLVTLSLWKVGRFLSGPHRYRTACDLEPAGDSVVTRPDGLTVPDLATIEVDLRSAIEACTTSGLFAEPPVTEVKWTPKGKGKGKN